MPKQSHVVGLDIGSSKIAVVVGQISEGLINVVGAAKVPSAGVRRGAVVDIEDCVSSISAGLEEAERMAGFPLESAWVSIAGSGVTITTSKGVIAVSRADGEIAAQDVERVIEAARAVALPPNREILHVIPRMFLVDGQEGIKDPVGMSGIRLETDALVIGGQVSAIRNLSKCIFQAGLTIENMVFTPLATARALLTKKQKETGVVLLDFGAGTTQMAVFEEGELVHAAVLPVGSGHITNDLAIGFRTSLEVAEALKNKFGASIPDQVRETESIDLSKLDPELRERIKRREVAEIIEARLKEMFAMIREELKGIGKDGMLPAGVVLTGGGSQLEGLTDACKIELHLPASGSHQMLEIAGMVDKVDSPVYAAAVGLMLMGMEAAEPAKEALPKLNINLKELKLGGVLDQAKKVFKQMLP